MGAGLISFNYKKYIKNTYRIFVSDGISGMAVNCSLIQRTNLALHVHPAGHKLADDDKFTVHKKCSTTIYTKIIFDVTLLVAMYILIFNTQWFHYFCFDLTTDSECRTIKFCSLFNNTF